MEEKNVLLGVPNSENDPVHHPSYYCDGGMECIDEMLVVFGLEATINFLNSVRGNIANAPE